VHLPKKAIASRTPPGIVGLVSDVLYDEVVSFGFNLLANLKAGADAVFIEAPECVVLAHNRDRFF
jgi:hypothetical protein